MKRSARLKELEEEAILLEIRRSLATQNKECEEEEEEGEMYLSYKNKRKRERKEAIQKKTLEDRQPSKRQEGQDPPRKKKREDKQTQLASSSSITPNPWTSPRNRTQRIIHQPPNGIL